MVIIISGTWIPQSVGYAAIVELEDSLVIIGGYSSRVNSRINKIFKYDVNLQTWTEVGTISQGKDTVTAMKVKTTVFDSCNSNG